MRTRIVVPIAAAILLVIAGGVGAYAYFFSGLRTSPSALALSTPSATATPSAASAAATTGTYAGAWQVASGSLAGYRVKEQFAGQTSTHEAVARTSSVTGTLTITNTGGTYQLTGGTITVQLAGLASVDSVAGYNVTNRDRIVQGSLDVGSFPTAVFKAQSVTIPADAAGGQTVTLQVPGQLTIHGVTKDVTANLQLRVTDTSAAQAAGTISIDMTDYGVQPPHVPITSVQSAVTIEVQLNLTRS